MKGPPDPFLRTLYRLRDVLQIRCGPLAGGLITGMGTVIIGLWFWREAGAVAYETGATHPIMAIYAVRLAAVAAIAGAQVLLLSVVVSRLYRPTVFDEVVKRIAGMICAVSLAAAGAFALLAR